MKICQILNNNAAIVKRGGSEIIVISKGIGFKKKAGMKVEASEIDKTYILDSYDMLEHFSYLLKNSDEDDVQLIDSIIQFAQEELNIEASDYLSLALLDHIEYMLKRSRKQQFVQNPLKWDVKRFYPKFYSASQTILKMIEEQKHIELPEDEAASIALHLINMQIGESKEQLAAEELEALTTITKIIQIHFKISLNQESTSYMRFVTHLQYFIERILKDELEESDETDALFTQIIQLYPEVYKCVEKINTYIEERFKTKISNSEKTYLMLHINRVISR